MLEGALQAVLRVMAGTAIMLALAATIGIPAGKRGPAAAQVGDEPRGVSGTWQDHPGSADVSQSPPSADQR